ncbi:MAG: tetratricopeptide repeat protein, partial [Thainema sp.]
GNLGDYEQAVKKYEKVTELDPNSLAAFFRWGDTLFELKNYEQAAKKYEKVTELDPNSSLAFFGWGSTLFELKDYEQAVEKYEKVIELDPNNSPVFNILGFIFDDLGDYEKSIDEYRKSIRAYEIQENKKDANFPFAYANLGITFHRLNNYPQAWQALDKAIVVYNQLEISSGGIQDCEALRVMGSIQLVYEHIDQARLFLERAFNLDETNIDVLILLVSLYIQIRDELTNQYNIFDLSDKENFGSYEQYELYRLKSKAGGKLVNQTGSAHTQAWQFHRQAKDILIKELDNAPNNAFVLNRLGNLSINIGKLNEAEDYFLRALEQDPDSAEAYANLGVLYTRKVHEREEDFEKAVDYFRIALNYEPNNLNIWSNLAETYLKLERLHRAEAEYRRILQISPGHVESLIGLAEVYVAMGVDGESEFYHRAIRYFTRAIRIADAKMGSKFLKNQERVDILYARAYAKVKLYESENLTINEKLLQSALQDLDQCLRINRSYDKARRAREKIKKQIQRFTPQWFIEKMGPVVILVLSVLVFALSQLSFFISWPIQLAGTNQYVVLTFGSLTFMVVSLYLPQILKLKVAGIELEKSSVNQIQTPRNIGINR